MAWTTHQREATEQEISEASRSSARGMSSSWAWMSETKLRASVSEGVAALSLLILISVFFFNIAISKLKFPVLFPLCSVIKEFG